MLYTVHANTYHLCDDSTADAQVHARHFLLAISYNFQNVSRVETLFDRAINYKPRSRSVINPNLAMLAYRNLNSHRKISFALEYKIILSVWKLAGPNRYKKRVRPFNIPLIAHIHRFEDTKSRLPLT